MANLRSNGAVKSGWRKHSERELRDQGAEIERVETLRAERECRVQKKVTELHRTLDSAVYFGPGEEVPHLGSGAAHRRATSIWEPAGRQQ